MIHNLEEGKDLRIANEKKLECIQAAHVFRKARNYQGSIFSFFLSDRAVISFISFYLRIFWVFTKNELIDRSLRSRWWGWLSWQVCLSAWLPAVPVNTNDAIGAREGKRQRSDCQKDEIKLAAGFPEKIINFMAHQPPEKWLVPQTAAAPAPVTYVWCKPPSHCHPKIEERREGKTLTISALFLWRKEKIGDKNSDLKSTTTK